MGPPTPDRVDDGQPAPLDGVSVVICRAVADRDELVADLVQRGATPVLAPLTERGPAPDGGRALSAAIDRLDEVAWVAVTSANGARALADAMGTRTWPTSTMVAAVGPATADALSSNGIPVDLVAPTASAAGLVEAMPSPAPPDAVVLAPLAEAAAPTLALGLEAKGYRVEQVTAYTTREPLDAADPALPAAVAAADVALMTAPSVVDRFVDRFATTGLPRHTVAIGPRTAARARERAMPAIVMARDHDRRGLVRAVVDTVTTYRSVSDHAPSADGST